MTEIRTLPQHHDALLMEFSLMGSPDRYADIAQALATPVEGCTTMEAASAGAEMVKSLIKQLEIP